MNAQGGGFHLKFIWTAGTFMLSAGLKFGLNIILSYLLAPDIMGVMVVVSAIRLGIELLTDVGIEQNMIHHPDGLDRHFRDTAWTLQLTRGLMLSMLFATASPWLADLYGIDVRVLLVAALSPMIGGAHSTAIFVLVKHLEVRRRNMFELASEALAFLVQVGLALWLRSIWAPAIGLVLAVAIRSALSFALPDARQRLHFDAAIAARIFHFGKWIAVTSLVTYAATNFDRLYLGKAVPLSLLGIYGIARAIAELPTTLARRMSYQIIFPALAGGAADDRHGLMAGMGKSRLLFVLFVGGGLAVGSAVADVAISFLYDDRYSQGGWMLSIMLMGGVFAILSNLNEALLLSAGRPLYSSIANSLRFATMAIALPVGLATGGFVGAIIAIALTECLQYLYMAVAQQRVGLHFWRQDLMVLGLAVLLFFAILLVRLAVGWGNPLSGMWNLRA